MFLIALQIIDIIIYQKVNSIFKIYIDKFLNIFKNLATNKV